MFCPECGFDAGEARFCPDCGTNLDQSGAVAIDDEFEDDAFETYDGDEGYFEEEVVRAPRPAPRRSGSHGRARKPSRQAAQSLTARGGVNRAASPAARPSRLSAQQQGPEEGGLIAGTGQGRVRESCGDRSQVECRRWSRRRPEELL